MISDYIDQLQASGRSTFTTDDAVAALGVSVPAARAALRRLKQKGHVAAPYRGFHVIVPPRYRSLGCRPAEQWVPQLMAHLREPYYAGLLTAARHHGAGHQAPMSFQVVVPSPRRDLTCGAVRVDFVARHDMAETPVVERNTETGVLRIATAEATALELVGYPERCGFLDNVATVLAELAEVLDGEALAAEARRAPAAWVQRLGFLLEHVEAHVVAEHLTPVLAERGAFPVALAPWKDTAGAPRSARWKVAVNIDLEPDL
jgi:predicted transcriptional regulator of viral defense system